MPTNSLQTSNQIVFDGTVDLPMAIVLGIVLAAIAAWLLFRERKVVGTLWASLFWLLRMTAVGVALWMLAGPNHETVERETIPQSIAILADVSSSMDTVDTPDAVELLRWALASEITENPSPLAICDSMQVALNMAFEACERASQMLREHRPLRQIKRELEKTQLATQRSVQHCRKLQESLADQYADFDQRSERVQTILEGPIQLALNELLEKLDSPQQALAANLTDSLDTLRDNLAGLRRRMTSLTSDLASALVENNSTASGDAYQWTRRDKSISVLDALQKDLVDDFSEEVRVRKFQFDSSLNPIAAERSWKQAAELVSFSEETGKPALTDLTAVLHQLSSERVTEATRLAIVLTDGNHTALSDEQPQEAATQIVDLPVYTVPIGNSDLIRDLRLHRVEAPATVIQNDSGIIEAIVTAVDCDGLVTEVSLRHDGQEIDRQKVAFVGDQVDRRVQFKVPAEQLGWQDYELTIEPLEDEESVANNVAPLSWEVVRDKLRVLLADGVSHWEFRYLQQLFRRDSHVECDELLFYPRLRGTGELAVNPRLPENVDDWAVYDVVILGDLTPQQFNPTSQEALAEYVRQRSGHLILYAGREHMPSDYRGQPLIDLLPVTASTFAIEEEGYTLMLTDEGRLHPALAIEDSNQESEAAWLDVYRKKPIYSLSEYSRPKPTARTLLRAVPTRMSVVVDDQATRDDLPAYLSWHQVGSGRVVYLSASESWKLRFRAHDRRHHRFWGQLMRWITAENLGSGTDVIRMTTDKNRYQRKEPIEVTVWLKDQTGRPLAGQNLQVTVRTLDEELSSVALKSDETTAGRYFCSIESMAPGAYELIVEGSIIDDLLATSEDKSVVRSMISIDAGDNLELLDTRCNRPLLQQVSELTGGQVVPPTAIAEVLQLASLSPEVKETVERTPLWNRWSNLWIVVGCLVVEWIVRKQKGLV